MSVQHYLRRYAEQEIHEIPQLDHYYDFVLVIPAFDEAPESLRGLKHLKTDHPVLVILVVNAPDNASEEKLRRTRALAEHVRHHFPLLNVLTANSALLELRRGPGHHLLLIERCGPDALIPRQAGVGLARKIGCDLACRLIAEGRINSSWIHNSDADVDFPANYFEAARRLDPKQTAAALFPFEHRPVRDPRLQQCIDLYEFSLHYYVEALDWAGSPYAFHSIGSTLLLNHEKYAKVRGFPKRAAGEDFYLLNKLAKTGVVIPLNRPVIKIATRESDRVPFGTGPALEKIRGLKNPVEDYLYYHPYCFLYLKAWLAALPALWHFKAVIQDISLGKLLSGLIFETGVDTKLLTTVLQELDARKALAHAMDHSKDQETFVRHVQTWFDGFKTLKFIHSLRDKGLGSVNRSALIQLNKQNRIRIF